MKYLFHLGHPAHFHLFKEIVKELKEKKHKVFVVIKQKDVLEKLLIESGFDYVNVFPRERLNGKLGITFSLMVRDFELLRFVKKNKPHLMIGTSAEITHIGMILRIKSIVVNEDDYDAVPFFSKLSYPFASTILTPSNCNVGNWEHKTVHYDGYHELAYLQPNNIESTSNYQVSKMFFLLRLAKLTAHHDEGKKGISNELASKIVSKLSPYGDVYISSERELPSNLTHHTLNDHPSGIIAYLKNAHLYIGDSQTMAAEAAVLGTPSIRFNDFVGKLGYLEELEHKYGLTYGIKTSEPEKLFQKIDELLAMPNLKEEWQRRRQKMLSEKIDVTAFMVWFIENYPQSVSVMKANPDYQYRFK